MLRHHLTLRERIQPRNRLAVFGVTALVVFALSWLVSLVSSAQNISAVAPSGNLAGLPTSQPIPRPTDGDDAAALSATRSLEHHRASLDLWLDNHFKEWVQEASSPSEEQVGSLPETGTSSPNHSSEFTINPNWAKLNEQLRAMQDRRAEYLERYTTEHPDLKKLELDLQDLQHALSNTPQYSSADVAQSPTSQTSTQRARQDEVTAERLAAVASFERLKSAVLGAQQALDRVKQDQLAKARAEWNAAAEKAEQFSRRSAAPSQQQPTSTPWLMLVVLAIIAGGAAAAASPAANDEPLENVADIQRVLQLPVIGTIPLRSADLEVRIGA